MQDGAINEEAIRQAQEYFTQSLVYQTPFFDIDVDNRTLVGVGAASDRTGGGGRSRWHRK